MAYTRGGGYVFLTRSGERERESRSQIERYLDRGEGTEEKGEIVGEIGKEREGRMSREASHGSTS